MTTRKATPATAYPPGYFTALVYAHNWPPRYEPQPVHAAPGTPKRGRPPTLTSAERERQAAAGIGWGTGAVVMAGTPKRSRPEWIDPGSLRAELARIARRQRTRNTTAQGEAA